MLRCGEASELVGESHGSFIVIKSLMVIYNNYMDEMLELGKMAFMNVASAVMIFTFAALFCEKTGRDNPVKFLNDSIFHRGARK
jgi:hypothetical protein